MNSGLKKLMVFTISLTLCLHSIALSSAFAEKIYLDINQPEIKKLALAIEGFDTLPVVFNTIKDDLEFTEYFRVYGPFPFKEETFDPSLWKSSDVEIIVRAETLNKISMKVFTVTSSSPIFVKEYPLKNDQATGNLIASDIYRLLTGKEAPFFNRFAFVRKLSNTMGIFLSNWNGKTIYDTGLRRQIISKVVFKGNKIFYSCLHGRFWKIEVFDTTTKTNKEIIKSKALLLLGDVLNESEFLYSESDGEISEIKISDIYGKTKTIYSSRWIDTSPRWTKSSIFFVSNRGGYPQIYQMTHSGREISRTTYNGRYNTEPAISPDGSKLAFSGLNGSFQVYVMDISSGIKTQVTRQGNNEQPSFCPDGHFLTIMSDRRGKKEIYLISSDGAVQKSLTHGYLPSCSR
ncbi:hypothetical protein V4D30_02515 [Thermodesulfovibrio sp. 3907-1M]|uniref:Translocation protein TolB n=1 Tax=Thermodesulfovibrio autotrophicus TaxID=3118333 RepID=A0AAU8GXF4_9BACT